MKKAKLILTASMFAFMGMSVMTSCTKDDKICDVGQAGSNCDQEVRTTYYNTYRGNGSDNTGSTYTNWGLQFSQSGTDITKMHMNLLDENNTPQLALDVTLQTNTTFKVDNVTNSQGFTYSGTGTINATTATLTLTEVNSGTTVQYTFNNMNK